MNKLLKIMTIVFWISAAGAGIGLIPGQIGASLSWAGIVLLAVHFIEYFVFNKLIQAKGDSTAKSLVMTLIYGVIYFKA